MIDVEEQLIRTTVENYFYGTYYGESARMKKAFLPDAHISGHIGGKYQDWSLSQFIARISEQVSQAEKKSKFDKKILFLDISGNAAIVKASVKTDELYFTDYITLLKIAGRWMIRNKSFDAAIQD